MANIHLRKIIKETSIHIRKNSKQTLRKMIKGLENINLRKGKK